LIGCAARHSTAVEISNDGESPGAGLASSCSGCGAGLAAGQRYCLTCGERRGPLPAGVAKWLSIVPAGGADAAESGGVSEADAAALDEPDPGSRYMPAPRTAAVAVMCLLAFGVLLGGLTGPAAQSAGIAPIVLYASAEEATPPSPSPVEAPTAAPVEAPSAVVSTAPETALPAAPAPVEASPAPAPTSKQKAPLELPEAPTLPPIQHVFLIVLGDNGYESALRNLAGAVPGEDPARQRRAALQLLRGGAGRPGQRDRPDQRPGTDRGNRGQLSQLHRHHPGHGCRRRTGGGCRLRLSRRDPNPAGTASGGWQEMEGLHRGRGRRDGAADANQVPLPGNPYETWRNPFVYFHSLIDGTECAESDVGLEQLATDLKSKGGTPALSYIVPNACHDGGEVACEPGQPSGLAVAEPFLRTVVPEIEASAAYKEEGGLIAITFAQAPHTETSTDSSACCGTPEYPNLPVAADPTAATPATGPVKPTGGGGRVGMLLISPYVEPGSANETGYYNHFSLLLSIEELFGLPPLGYAAEPALSPFDDSVFNAEPARAAPTR
jgi:hypothetical protein